ncbi:hypothetical protein BgiMline_008552 [Biomphalaria glabrata]|uniref:Uncharacterized protein LOC106056959 n=1 Tax=Biomphalaria glabrata TaxID=6526 RepID=A0A9U8E1S9_BIOGL|nr:uncharacterized protein LOC106056959 [Biomphalaria glabrata]KAI8747480.1 hypothetical protein BgiMline_019198 [Biomphalaria glabrata]
MSQAREDKYKLKHTVKSLLSKFLFTAESILDMDTRVAAVLLGLHAQSHLPPACANFFFGVMGAAVYALLKCWPKYARHSSQWDQFLQYSRPSSGDQANDFEVLRELESSLV